VLTTMPRSDTYNVGDVVTYVAKDNPNLFVTHRIIRDLGKIQGGEESFETKGDANINGDLIPVAYSQLQGRVLLVIPYAGFIYQYEHSRKGFVLICILSFFFLVLPEFYTILRFCEACMLSFRSYFIRQK